jgi:hypothetical protein
MSGLLRSRVIFKSKSSFASSLYFIQRRNAGGAYSHFKVKKQNWVEQNEIYRENQFMTWAVVPKNILYVVFLVGLPLGFRSLYMQELAIRDAEQGRPVHERM